MNCKCTSARLYMACVSFGSLSSRERFCKVLKALHITLPTTRVGFSVLASSSASSLLAANSKSHGSPLALVVLRWTLVTSPATSEEDVEALIDLAA